MLSWRATLVVYICWLAASDRNQCCSGIFHHALWVEIWEGTLYKLVDIHDSLLFSEHPHHSAIEGEKKVPSPLHEEPHTSLVANYFQHDYLVVLESLISYFSHSLNFPTEIILFEHVPNIQLGKKICIHFSVHAFYHRCYVSQSSLHL